MSFTKEELEIIHEIESLIDYESSIEKLREISNAAWDGKLESSTIRAWLGNFSGSFLGSETAERNLALWLALNFTFYTDSDVRSLSKNLWWKYVHSVLDIIDQDDDCKSLSFDEKIQCIQDSTVIQPLGNAGGSGTNVTYFFRQVNNLSENMFSFQADSENHKFLVLVDDATLSGSQATEELEKYDAYTNVTKFLLTFISTNKAKEKLHGKCKVISAIDFDDRAKCFTEGSYVFYQHEKWLPLAKKMCKHYGKQIYGRNPLGYKDGQYLFGFYIILPTIRYLYSGKRIMVGRRCS